MSGIGKTCIWHGRYCKNQLSQKLDFLWFQVRSFMIFGDFGTNFHDFCCPGDWLEIWWLFRVILGSSQILRESLVGGKLGGSRALSNTNPGSLKPDSRDPETETGNLETEKRVHRIHDTLETGLHMIPRSLVAPSRGAGGFYWPGEYFYDIYSSSSS